VPEGQCMAVPAGVAIRDAAALPEACITIWANLFEPRRLFPGSLFLVQGGSSGIGSMAIQMARRSVLAFLLPLARMKNAISASDSVLKWLSTIAKRIGRSG
jgi:D-arabinose 1-dehydrogenase-like Zn-dependent alcohol dehydrogenase